MEYKVTVSDIEVVLSELGGESTLKAAGVKNRRTLKKVGMS